MSVCRNCGIRVGCGCQLVNGLCGQCQSAAIQTFKKFKNVITKTFGMYRMF